MAKRSTSEIEKELLNLRTKISRVEKMLTGRRPAMGRKEPEIDLHAIVSELTYSLITSNASLAGIADIVLNYAKVFTRSEYGYVSSIDPETGDNLCHTLTGMIGDSCKISQYEKGIVFPIRADGTYPALWGHCLNTRKAFFTNSPATHPATAGTPDRHIPLFSFLSVPAIIGSDLFGQISLANSPGGYNDQDLEGVKRLAAIYALAIQREQTRTILDQEVARRRQLEETVNIGRGQTGNTAVSGSWGGSPVASDVEELNTALRVLLAQRDTERKELEQKIFLNVDKLITPYIQKLKLTSLDPKQRTFLSIIENNVADIISPFLSKAIPTNAYLTPQEIQVASLVRSGAQTKEIAELLDISVNAVNFHRKNIRAKLGLKNEQVNLRSFLLTLSEPV
jgi:DNA-binding CsgD family transcriptional regulator